MEPMQYLLNNFTKNLTQAQEELLMAFDEALAYHSYTTFEKFIGGDYIERCLKNNDTLRALCQSYKKNHYSIRYVTYVGEWLILSGRTDVRISIAAFTFDFNF